MAEESPHTFNGTGGYESVAGRLEKLEILKEKHRLQRAMLQSEVQEHRSRRVDKNIVRKLADPLAFHSMRNSPGKETTHPKSPSKLESNYGRRVEVKESGQQIHLSLYSRNEPTYHPDHQRSASMCEIPQPAILQNLRVNDSKFKIQRRGPSTESQPTANS